MPNAREIFKGLNINFLKLYRTAMQECKKQKYCAHIFACSVRKRFTVLCH